MHVFAWMAVTVYGRAFFLATTLQHTACVEHSFRVSSEWPGSLALFCLTTECRWRNLWKNSQTPGSAPGEAR